LLLSLAVNAYIGYSVDMSRDATHTETKLIRMSPELVQRIADYRFEHRLPSEAEAIRRLIELGLNAAPPASGPAPASRPIEPVGNRAEKLRTDAAMDVESALLAAVTMPMRAAATTRRATTQP
jgi:hypothetical protein